MIHSSLRLHLTDEGGDLENNYSCLNNSFSRGGGFGGFGRYIFKSAFCDCLWDQILFVVEGRCLYKKYIHAISFVGHWAVVGETCPIN